jgi:hypothetical protein
VPATEAVSDIATTLIAWDILYSWDVLDQKEEDEHFLLRKLVAFRVDQIIKGEGDKLAT